MYRTLFYSRLQLRATSGLCPSIISWPSVRRPDSCPGAQSLPSSHQRPLISIQYYLTLRLQIPISQPSFNYSHCWITLTREISRLARQRVLPHPLILSISLYDTISVLHIKIFCTSRRQPPHNPWTITHFNTSCYYIKIGLCKCISCRRSWGPVSSWAYSQ